MKPFGLGLKSKRPKTKVSFGLEHFDGRYFWNLTWNPFSRHSSTSFWRIQKWNLTLYDSCHLPNLQDKNHLQATLSVFSDHLKCYTTNHYCTKLLSFCGNLFRSCRRSNCLPTKTAQLSNETIRYSWGKKILSSLHFWCLPPKFSTCVTCIWIQAIKII